MQPLVSIITPAFNSAKYIGETIISVQNQTFRDWEMIVVDDFSTDDTPQIVSGISQKDSRIRYFRLEKNSGTGIARQMALEKAGGKFIAFLDADDLWLPQKLEKQLGFMEKEQLHFTFSFYDCIDETGNLLGKKVEAPKNLSYRQLFFCNFVGNLTGIYDSRHFGKIGISPIRKRQDWMMWLTILKKIRSGRPIPESLALYRVRQDSISASKTELIRHNFAVYRQFHKLGVIVSVFCMAGFLFTQFLVKPRYIHKSKH